LEKEAGRGSSHGPSTTLLVITIVCVSGVVVVTLICSMAVMDTLPLFTGFTHVMSNLTSYNVYACHVKPYILQLRMSCQTLHPTINAGVAVPGQGHGIQGDGGLQRLLHPIGLHHRCAYCNYLLSALHILMRNRNDKVHGDQGN